MRLVHNNVPSSPRQHLFNYLDDTPEWRDVSIHAIHRLNSDKDMCFSLP